MFHEQEALTLNFKNSSFAVYWEFSLPHDETLTSNAKRKKLCCFCCGEKNVIR